MSAAGEGERMRLDKWLWAARFFKTRSLAVEAIERSRIGVNGAPAKASRDLKVGDQVSIRTPGLEREYTVVGLSSQRGPAPVAQLLYEETVDSRQRHAAWLAARASGVEPALAHTHGRPTKHDRRALADWQRWSASADEPPDKP